VKAGRERESLTAALSEGGEKTLKQSPRKGLGILPPEGKRGGAQRCIIRWEVGGERGRGTPFSPWGGERDETGTSVHLFMMEKTSRGPSSPREGGRIPSSEGKRDRKRPTRIGGGIFRKKKERRY